MSDLDDMLRLLQNENGHEKFSKAVNKYRDHLTREIAKVMAESVDPQSIRDICGLEQEWPK